MTMLQLLLTAACLTSTLSGSAMAQAPAANVVRDCPTCPEMVAIPAGSFLMGDSPDADTTAGPLRTVTIPRDFLMGRYPVTRGEYTAFTAATGGRGPDGCDWYNPGFRQTDRDPVVCVSAADAEAYAVWLSRETGKIYRLPAEAEWEYAARAGTTTARYWGDDMTNAERYAWFNRSGTAPVGGRLPNKFGLYDMLGNV